MFSNASQPASLLHSRLVPPNLNPRKPLREQRLDNRRIVQVQIRVTESRGIDLEQHFVGAEVGGDGHGGLDRVGLGARGVELERQHRRREGEGHLNERLLCCFGRSWNLRKGLEVVNWSWGNKAGCNDHLFKFSGTQLLLTSVLTYLQPSQIPTNCNLKKTIN